jgi:sulfane dehydrogenase subunit SoxC
VSEIPDLDPIPETESSRRRFLRFGAALGGAIGGLAGCSSPNAEAPSAPPKRLGAPVSAYGERSPFDKSTRHLATTKTPEAASTRAPLQDSYGIITPSSLHFERHHSGVPTIDPAEHRLLLHGMVDRPLILTMDDILRLPSVNRVHFVECAGNGRSEWGPKTAPNAQQSHGLASCSEWTGVPLSVLLQEVGVQSGASWLLAEGADPCKMQRSIPLAKAMDDIIVAYGQNGEDIRPEQGFPLRLVIPGYEGNMSVKWLRRIKLDSQPYMVRDETSKYSDLLPDGTARIFSYEMEAKSVITRPSGGQKINGAGPVEITGLAWSGRGRIERVEVSTDNGQTWQNAEIQEPRYTKAFTRFRLPWRWDGAETVLQSRCTDDTGYVQPANEALIAARGMNSDYHNNAIKSWKIGADGSVENVNA